MSKQRILIIEDDKAIRENLVAILELSEYECLSAENGMTGVQLALKEPIDLILCDVMMPQLDGFGVLNILRKKPATKKIPFVFLTANAENDDFRRGMNLGADDYLTKPFLTDDLLKVIEVRLKKGASNAENSPTPNFEFRNPEMGYAQLKLIMEAQPEKTYQEKEIIFPENKLLHQLYWVKSGRIKITKLNEFGKEYIISVQDSSKTFGYSAIFRNQPTGFAATAIEPSVITTLPRDQFLEQIKVKPDINFYFLQKLAKNLHHKEAELTDLAYNPIRKRVSDALFELSQQFEKGIIHMSRDDLAHFVGTAKESLVRVLSEFKKEGWVRLEGNDIEILLAEKMREFYG